MVASRAGCYPVGTALEVPTGHVTNSTSLKASTSAGEENQLLEFTITTHRGVRSYRPGASLVGIHTLVGFKSQLPFLLSDLEKVT